MQIWDSALPGNGYAQWNWGSELGAQRRGSSRAGTLTLEQEHQWLVLSFWADAMRLVLTNEEGQQTRTTYAAETSGCWEGRVLLGQCCRNRKQTKDNVSILSSHPQVPCDTLLGRPNQEPTDKEMSFSEVQPLVSEDRVRRQGNWIKKPWLNNQQPTMYILGNTLKYEIFSSCAPLWLRNFCTVWWMKWRPRERKWC